MAAVSIAFAVVLVETAIGAAVRSSANRHVAGAITSAALRVAWQLAAASTFGAPLEDPEELDDEHFAADQWADHSVEQQVQDRLRLIGVAIRAQVCKAIATGHDVHSAKGLVEDEVALRANVAKHGGFHVDKLISQLTVQELKKVQRGRGKQPAVDNLAATDSLEENLGAKAADLQAAGCIQGDHNEAEKEGDKKYSDGIHVGGDGGRTGRHGVRQRRRRRRPGQPQGSREQLAQGLGHAADHPGSGADTEAQVIGELTEEQNFVMTAEKDCVVAVMYTEASAVTGKLVQDKLGHDLNGDAQAAAVEASTQHVEGEPLVTAVESSWWQEVQSQEAGGGYFKQCDTLSFAREAVVAEGVLQGSRDNECTRRKEASQLKHQKAAFKMSIAASRLAAVSASSRPACCYVSFGGSLSEEAS